MINYKIVKWKNYGFINPKPAPDSSLAVTLDEYLQYTRQGAEYMPNPQWAKVRLYSRKKGMFPWGLLKTVAKIMNTYCEKTGDTYSISQKNVEKTIEGDVGVTLRDYQKEAVAALAKHKGGILCLPTGSGKTITIIEYLKLMNVPSLVVVPTLDIKKQWEGYKLPNVIVSTYQNPKLKNEMEQYDCIVFDEVHHVAAKSLYTLAMKVKTEAILVGCSATVKREDGEDMRITAALGEIVYNKSRKELIEQGWIANALVTYLKPTFTNSGRYMKYPEVYLTQIVNNEDRNTRIIAKAYSEAGNGRKVLILVSHIEHGQKLLEMMNTATYKIVFMNGQSKDRDRDMSVYDIIIATAIYDEGYDLPALDCLILAAGGKSSIKLTQRIGRVLRPKNGRFAHIYDFIDSTKYLKTHYLKRRELLEEEFEVEEED